MDSLYSKSYFSDEDENNSEDIHVSDGTEKFGISTGCHDISVSKEEKDFYDTVSKGRMEKFRFSINELKSLHPTSKSILDIGTGTGDFLSIAKSENLDIDGVEYSEYAAGDAEKKLGIKIFREIY